MIFVKMMIVISELSMHQAIIVGFQHLRNIAFREVNHVHHESIKFVQPGESFLLALLIFFREILRDDSSEDPSSSGTSSRRRWMLLLHQRLLLLKGGVEDVLRFIEWRLARQRFEVEVSVLLRR